MSKLSPEARQAVEGLLSGQSLDELAPAGTALRREVEEHLISALDAGQSVSGSAGASAPSRKSGSRRASASAPPSKPPLPGGGLAVAFSDGACRGNPGPAAVGVRILDPDGEELLAEGAVIGRTTNNVAEYHGAIHALERASDLGLDKLELRMDSELVVKQLNGQYRVKQPALVELKAQVDRLRGRFQELRVTHVRRELNREADLLANEALDNA